MKKWLETRQVLDRLAELRSEGRRAAMATVVRVRGSAYRHEGARMLVADDGSSVGNVSGGCLEADVREVALHVIASSRAERREYCGSADEIAAWDLGVGCEGMVDVHIALADDTFAQLVRPRLDGDAPFAVLQPLDGDGPAELVDAAESGVRAVGGQEVFVDAFTPPPTVLVLSAGDDARPLARFAADVGFRVVVADRRAALLSAERFGPGVALVDTTQAAVASLVGPDTYAVVMNHNYADDREQLRTLLGTSARYIGMLGPRQRTDRMLAELGTTARGALSRVYGPVGLDIGTDGAEQVAMAVVAEILAVRSGRRPASLRERRTPIHDAAPLTPSAAAPAAGSR